MEHHAGCALMEKTGDQCTCIEDSCGCVFCDLDLPVFEGQHIKEDYHRAPNGDRIVCTKKLSK